MAKALYVLAGYDDNTEKYLSGIQNNCMKAGLLAPRRKIYLCTQHWVLSLVKKKKNWWNI